jgi:hypothetical protein
MAQPLTIRPDVYFAAVLAFLSGGLAGSVFTWFINRPEPTLLTYNTSATMTGGQSVKSTIPQLRLQIGKEEIPVVYSHSVEVSFVRGPYVDTATLALTFSPDTRIFGYTAEAPSPVHRISCAAISGGTKCELSPLNAADAGKYRITLVTDKDTAPTVVTSTKNIKLYRLEQFATSQPFWDSILSRENFPKSIAFLTFTVVYAFFTFYFLRKLKSSFRFPGRPMVVGKILDPMGHPVPGAEIELLLSSPSATYAPTVTDSKGDFIFGSARKLSFFAGKMRVVHSGYEPLTVEVNTPIVVETLKPVQ